MPFIFLYNQFSFDNNQCEKGKKMKISIKLVSALAVMTAVITCLTGCANYSKQKALYDYTSSLSTDTVYIEAAQDAAKRLSSTTDYKMAMSQLKTVISYMDKVVESANDRNSNLTDPEIKDIDNSYVQYISDLSSAYKSLYDGYYTYDDAKIRESNVYLESSLDNATTYVNKLDAFCKKYHIKGADTDALRGLINDARPEK